MKKLDCVHWYNLCVLALILSKLEGFSISASIVALAAVGMAGMMFFYGDKL